MDVYGELSVACSLVFDAVLSYVIVDLDSH